MAVPLKNEIMLKQVFLAQKLKIQWCSPEFFTPIFVENSHKSRILWMQTSSIWVLQDLWIQRCILWYVLPPVNIWELISQATTLNHERRSQGRQRKRQIIFNSFIINCQLYIDWTCTIARSTTVKNLASGILFPQLCKCLVLFSLKRNAGLSMASVDSSL